MRDGLERIFDLVETSLWGEDGGLGPVLAVGLCEAEMGPTHSRIVSSRHVCCVSGECRGGGGRDAGERRVGELERALVFMEALR